MGDIIPFHSGCASVTYTHMASTSSTIAKLFMDGRVFVENDTVAGKKSNVWKHFSLRFSSKEYSTAPGEYNGIVLCCLCKYPLKHNRITSGNTHLHDHVTHCSQNPSN